MRRRLPAAASLLAAALVVPGAALGPVGPASAVAPRHTVGGPTLDLPGVHMLAKPGATLTAVKAVPGMGKASWVIADATTGEVLAAKGAHERRRPASTLKTLTAVTLLDKLDPDSTYTPVYADVAAEGSKVGIVNGSRYTIEQLWYGLFLASGNDTAHALARANGGMAKTVVEMNDKAKRLQAYDTVARNDSGLDATGQHSSAYDLALIARAGLAMPAFEKYCSTVRVKFPRAGKKAKRKTFMTYNHNPLLIGGYKGAIGVKTGYTDLARRTFVGAAKRGDRTLIVTIMGYEGNTYRSGEALLDWGFKNAKHAQPVGQLVEELPPAEASASAAANAAQRTTPTTKAAAGVASSGSSHRFPLWPFLVLGLLVIAFAVWSLRSSIPTGSADPLAAANKGLGKSRGVGSGRNGRRGPRGRGGTGSY
jgi:D-alanyl-D-alanine carboxypeptidase (penicillin-binding protein 5/6)